MLTAMSDEHNIEPGRPTKYQPKYCKQVVELLHAGFTEKEIADFFEVSPDTITEWKNRYPKFKEAIQTGRMKPVGKVAAKLYERAIGYTYEEVYYEKIMPEEELPGLEGTGAVTQDLYRVKVVKKYLPPDVNAQRIYLNNRASKHWGEKQQVEVTATDPEMISQAIKALTPEAIAALSKKFEEEY